MWDQQILRQLYTNFLSHLQSYGYTAIKASFICCVVIYIILLLWHFMHKEKNFFQKDFFTAFWSSIFVFYVYILLQIVFFSRVPGSRVIHMEFMGTYYGPWCTIYFVENAIMLVPLGFLLPKIWHKLDHFIIIVFLSLLSSCFIECIQYVTRLGYTELDDIWTNVLGGCIGYILHWLVPLPSKKGKKHKDAKS